MLLGFLLYLVSFKYILKEKTFSFWVLCLKAHGCSLILFFVFNVFFGFLLMKFVVFSDSDIPVRKQFFAILRFACSTWR
jgi:hypothetical protein